MDNVASKTFIVPLLLKRVSLPEPACYDSPPDPPQITVNPSFVGGNCQTIPVQISGASRQYNRRQRRRNNSAIKASMPL
jgi:hypothetical protein